MDGQHRVEKNIDPPRYIYCQCHCYFFKQKIRCWNSSI